MNCAPRPNPATFAPRAGSVLEGVWNAQGRVAPSVRQVAEEEKPAA